MIYVYIGAALAVGVLIGIVTLSVFWLSRQVSDNVLHRTLELISAYDALIDKKSRELEKLIEEVKQQEELPAETGKPEQETGGTGLKDEKAGEFTVKAVEHLTKTSYVDGAFSASYQKIRSSFGTDPLRVLPGFLAKERKEGEATSLLKQLSTETVFRLSGLTADEQLAVLRESLTAEQLHLTDEYLAGGKTFSAIDFYDFLRLRSAAEQSSVLLRVNPRDMDRDYPEGVRVIADPGICEGFQIEADNVMYDYSVTERELS